MQNVCNIIRKTNTEECLYNLFALFKDDNWTDMGIY